MSILRVPIDLGATARAGELSLRGEAARYLLRVRRAEVGDRFIAFDPARALEVDAELVEAGRDVARLAVGEPRPAVVVPRRQITLIQGVGKGDKLDAVVRDATELGATRISPAIAARSVARRDGASAQPRLERIAVEAARQCGRGDVPRIDPARPLDAIVAASDALVRIALVPGATRSFGALLRAAPEGASIALAVGPEGGFADQDRDALAGASFVEATLGPLVLRTETVCAAVLGALLAFD